ncbi:ImmA/IrrE family metallo-endopeptidase [Christensenella timonensis]|uniref:ImmA/IrrE family metallo-endopeptidase n=1 Tax=Christensenella timonensis TaxID=1816678 RepID=UPI000836600A|nr:ImmA/IrrE family metallo-endopeptidase [Christensenella timonensis]
MANINVPVNPKVLQWAINKANLDFDDVLYTFPKLNKWLEGISQPTIKQIEKLSMKTHIPFGYFFLKTPPEEKIELLEYRTIQNDIVNQPSRELVDTIYDMERRQEWMKEYLIQQDESPLSFVHSVYPDDSVLSIVEKIRKDINIKKEWYVDFKTTHDSFVYLRRKVEAAGIMIMMNGVVGNNTHRKLDVSEFRAFVIVDKYAPLIFINAGDAWSGRIFSLCHELAHIWFGISELYNETYKSEANYANPIEIKCNAVAAELLVPRDVFDIQWNQSNISDVSEKIKDLAKYFNVSNLVIAKKAFDTKKVAISIYNEIYEETMDNVKEKNQKGNGGGDYFKTAKSRMDFRFFKAISDSVNNGTLLYTDAYKLTGLSRNSFEHFEKTMMEGQHFG